MNRKPIYAKNNPAYRIVSVPNGLWRLQEREAVQGTKTVDNWSNRCPPLEHDEALSVLGRYHIEKKAA